MLTRALAAEDFELVTSVMDTWWGGRPVRALLHRLFFEHFGTTSFVVTDGGNLVAFLVGFRSQSRPQVAYIHFVGVAPESRGAGIASELYRRFFATVKALGCTEVQAVTSPGNTGSIAFHRRLGFVILQGNGEREGVPVMLDHGGPGQHKVLFHRTLGEVDGGPGSEDVGKSG